MKTVLVIVAVIGFAAVIGAIVMGTVSFDGLVTENPYERGIAWDSERTEREGSGIEVSLLTREVSTGRASLTVMVTEDGGRPYMGPLGLRLTRPETASLDRSYTVESKGAGRYTAEVELPVHGWWEVLVEVPLNGKMLEFKDKFYAKDGDGK